MDRTATTREQKTIEYINNQQPAQIEYSISSYRLVLLFLFFFHLILRLFAHSALWVFGQRIKNREVASRNEIVHINCPTEEVSNCGSVARLAAHGVHRQCVPARTYMGTARITIIIISGKERRQIKNNRIE